MGTRLSATRRIKGVESGMKKIFVVNHGTYPFDVLVGIGTRQEDIVKWLERKNNEKLTDSEKETLWMEGGGRTIMLSGGQTILRVKDIKNKAEFYACLSHEIFHAVEFLFSRLDIKHDMDKSGEAFAYQIQYLTRSILEKINR